MCMDERHHAHKILFNKKQYDAWAVEHLMRGMKRSSDSIRVVIQCEANKQ